MKKTDFRKTLSQDPFFVKTPEDLCDNDIIDLFIDEFSEVDYISRRGHAIVIGPRGSGKSMMLKYLDVASPIAGSNRNKTKCYDFIGIYVPIKKYSNISELTFYEEHPSYLLLVNHYVSSFLGTRIFQALSEKSKHITSNNEAEVIDLIEAFHRLYLLTQGMDLPSLMPMKTLREKIHTYSDAFSYISQWFLWMFSEIRNSVKDSITKKNSLLDYHGSLIDYQSFVFPILEKINNTLPFKNRGPFYLLIDDAHWLNTEQTRVLNTIIASRTSNVVSIKVSAEESYSTYYTSTGNKIQTPHDYEEIRVYTKYTSSKNAYFKQIERIVKKRLELAGHPNSDVYTLFPTDTEQEAKINEIKAQYINNSQRGLGRGANVNDDAYRYSIPDFIRETTEIEGEFIREIDCIPAREEFISGLAGYGKSSSTYSYSGFDQLVHLSSGIFRNFLTPASKMYSRYKSEKGISGFVTEIPPNIQNDIVRDHAYFLLFGEIEQIKKADEPEHIKPNDLDIQKLLNLLHGLGGLFRLILLTPTYSERRVFSFALTNSPNDEVDRIIRLGIELGYLHKTYIGTKDSRIGGKTELYILNRALAPIWTLDPTGFAGYKFVKTEMLQGFIDNPVKALNTFWGKEIKKKPNNEQILLEFEE